MSERLATHAREFHPTGRVIARQDVKLGKAYAVGQEISEKDRPDEQTLARLWRTAQVDTLPRK